MRRRVARQEDQHDEAADLAVKAIGLSQGLGSQPVPPAAHTTRSTRTHESSRHYAFAAPSSHVA